MDRSSSRAIESLQSIMQLHACWLRLTSKALLHFLNIPTCILVAGAKALLVITAELSAVARYFPSSEYDAAMSSEERSLR